MMRRAPLSSKSLLLAALALLLLLAASLPAAEGKKQPTHYDVLELQQDATLKDIKKAYRKLAVQHHPDRNPDNVEAATSKFREIAEAYEVLSDEDARRDYDRALKGGFGGDGSGFKWTYGDATGGAGGRQRPRRRHRDAFATFNDAFQNDPFFADAFKSMDDLFDKHFSNSGSNGQRGRTQSSDAKDVDNAGGSAGGWIWDKVKDYMPHVEVKTSSSSSFGGSTTYSSTSHSFGGGGSSRRSSSRSRSGGSGGRSSYTSRSTRTIMQNGQRVTIQTLEKDGNRIEEKYIGEKLIERKINGLKEDIGRIGQDEF